MNFKLILGILLACLTALFVVQNTEVVAVKFLFWELSMSRAVLIFLVLVVGIVLGWMLRGWAYHKRR